MKFAKRYTVGLLVAGLSCSAVAFCTSAFAQSTPAPAEKKKVISPLAKYESYQQKLVDKQNSLLLNNASPFIYSKQIKFFIPKTDKFWKGKVDTRFGTYITQRDTTRSPGFDSQFMIYMKISSVNTTALNYKFKGKMIGSQNHFFEFGAMNPQHFSNPLVRFTRGNLEIQARFDIAAKIDKYLLTEPKLHRNFSRKRKLTLSPAPYVENQSLPEGHLFLQPAKIYQNKPYYLTFASGETPINIAGLVADPQKVKAYEKKYFEVPYSEIRVYCPKSQISLDHQKYYRIKFLTPGKRQIKLYAKLANNKVAYYGTLDVEVLPETANPSKIDSKLNMLNSRIPTKILQAAKSLLTIDSKTVDTELKTFFSPEYFLSPKSAIGRAPKKELSDSIHDFFKLLAINKPEIANAVITNYINFINTEPASRYFKDQGYCAPVITSAVISSIQYLPAKQQKRYLDLFQNYFTIRGDMVMQRRVIFETGKFYLYTYCGNFNEAVFGLLVKLRPEFGKKFLKFKLPIILSTKNRMPIFLLRGIEMNFMHIRYCWLWRNIRCRRIMSVSFNVSLRM